VASDRNPSPEQALIWLRPEGGRRGPRPALTRDDITRVAIELAESEGLDAVSMRRIGARLGTGATSLYTYVRSKNDLYELMVDEVVGQIRLPHPSGDWRTDLRTVAERTYAVLRRHPWFVQLGIQPGLGPNTQRYGQATLAALDGLGRDLATRINVLAALNNYVVGFLHRETAWEHLQRRSGLSKRGWTARLRRYVDQAIEQDAALGDHLAARLELTSRDSFRFGLDCFIDGVAAHLHAE
jgi:AcrR family transcriptional regulator